MEKSVKMDDLGVSHDLGTMILQSNSTRWFTMNS